MVEDADDTGVPQRRQRLNLTPHRVQRHSLGAVHGLDRRLAPGLRVDRGMDDAHAPTPELATELPRTNRGQYTFPKMANTARIVLIFSTWLLNSYRARLNSR